MGEGVAAGRVAAVAEVREPAGDRALHCLVDLYRDHERRIHRICFAHLGNEADAEDATQETFIRGANYLDKLTGDPGPYLSKVAHTVCCDELRRRRSRDALAASAASDMVADTEELALPRAELKELWLQLSEKERSLLSLTYAGYSYEEVARRTGRSLSATAIAVMRARGHARALAAASAVILASAAAWRAVSRFARRMFGATSTPNAGVALLPAAFVATASLTATLIFGAALPRSVGPANVAAVPHLLAADPSSGTRASVAPASADTHAPAATASTDSAPSSPQRGGPQPVSPGSLAGQVINPGSNATPADATFTGFAASPHYQQDGTVFASGALINGCLRPSLCAVLFASHDRGATWTNLHATSFAGGRILVPPTYPASLTLFAAGPLGLQRSDDGGLSFRVVLPTPGPAALVPGDGGAADVVVASQPVMIYASSTGAVRPGPALPPLVSTPSDVAAVGRDLLITATLSNAGAVQGGSDGVVLRCPHAGGCTVVSTLHAQPYLSLSVSPTAAEDHTAWAYSPQALLVSHDDGATFQMAPTRPAGSIQALAPAADFATSGVLVIDTTITDATGQINSSVVRTSQRGQAELGRVGLPADSYVNTVTLLPDGRILAGPLGRTANDLGLSCSTDEGASWRASC